LHIARSIVDTVSWTLDELRGYNRALSDAEIAQLATP